MNRRKDITQGWEFCGLAYRFGKRIKTEKEKLSYYNTGIHIWSPSQVGAPPNRAEYFSGFNFTTA